MMIKLQPRHTQRMRMCYDITQEELGALLGVTGQTVSNWESGRAVPERFDRAVLARMWALTLIQPDLSRLRKSLPELVTVRPVAQRIDRLLEALYGGTS
jgi:transcriptional regulator with XRE-family HTH domain